MNYKSIGFVAARSAEAQAALKTLKARYKHVPPRQADLVVALGGDGFMLRALHRFMERPTPIFGMNRGSIGFLMNRYAEGGLTERLRRAQPIVLHPLRMVVQDTGGKKHQALAINEVSLLRQTRLAAKLRILVDGVVQIEEMICDGILLSTPAGSTAYNVSVHGPIIPLGAGVLALTPISAFRPRRWHGALLPQEAVVTFDVLDPGERRVSACADYTEVRRVRHVTVNQDRSIAPTLLFDPEHNLEERILKEQFQP